MRTRRDQSPLREITPGIWAEEHYSSGLVGMSLNHGRLFYATTDRIAAGTGESIRITLENPAGSGVNLTIVHVVAVIGPNQITNGNVFINPDTGLPATAFTPFNATVGHSYASKGVLKADTSTTELSGGTATDLHLSAHQGRNDIPALFVVSPGVTIGINIPLGTLQTGDGMFAAHYVETDA